MSVLSTGVHGIRTEARCRTAISRPCACVAVVYRCDQSPQRRITCSYSSLPLPLAVSVQRLTQGSIQMDFPIGATVVINLGRGVVRFCGTTSFSSGKWVGIELSEPVGKNDGSVQGVTYFSCRTDHGVFVKASQVKLVQDPQPPT